MADVNYRVNHVGVDDVHGELVRRTRDISMVLQQLNNTGRTLETWEGQAQIAYQAAQKEWTSAANSMVDLLNTRATRLQQINANYADYDREASRRLG